MMSVFIWASRDYAGPVRWWTSTANTSVSELGRSVAKLAQSGGSKMATRLAASGSLIASLVWGGHAVADEPLTAEGDAVGVSDQEIDKTPSDCMYYQRLDYTSLQHGEFETKIKEAGHSDAGR